MATNVFKRGSKDAKIAMSFLHNITYSAGFRTTDQRQNGSSTIPSNLVDAATAVCKEVINREFNDVDSAIHKLTYVDFQENLTGSRAKTIRYDYDQEVATALVYLAECLNLYWDDLNATKHEKETFSKTTLGRAVEAYGRFTSMISTATVAAQIPTANTNTPKSSKSTTPRVPGQAPKNPYKSSGPQSGNVRDLQGTPGQKLLAQGNEIYRIIGDHSSSNNIPQAFIRPLKANATVNGTNKVFVNSGKGYGECTCWFDDATDAQNFLDEVLAKVTIDPAITNLRVVRSTKVDHNGYYLVGTECGVCGIQASKLNEAIDNELVETIDTENTCWDKTYKERSVEEKQEFIDYMHKE